MAYMQQQGGYEKYPPQAGGYGGGYAQAAPMGGSPLDQRRARVQEKPAASALVCLLAGLEDIICAGCLDAVF
ncbi:hypothetical protein Malapachy_0259 [Malassezia pachydermatis]|uniref:Uncharacterized protein n=1 Tax=Malassezia pachydermatis TaxID=77020 RepID=A0A0M8MTJ7_9BASI|nr:hypothetical protein Malapachy_0259 [Malassezia pachydermatis]KOS13331.1 hypothetical protein Malapachy_0259 [Malassezia pachydermatis]